MSAIHTRACLQGFQGESKEVGFNPHIGKVGVGGGLTARHQSSHPALLNASLNPWQWATMDSLAHSFIHPFTHLSSKTQQGLKELGLPKVSGIHTAP